MTAEDLRKEFIEKTGFQALNEHGKYSVTYGKHLESLVLAAEEREREIAWQAFKAGEERAMPIRGKYSWIAEKFKEAFENWYKHYKTKNP